MKKYSVVFSDEAYDDLDAIFYGILSEYQDLLGARRTVNRIIAKCHSLEFFPNGYIVRKVIDSFAVRYVRSGKFIAAYYIDEGQKRIIILRIVYGGMDLDVIFG